MGLGHMPPSEPPGALSGGEMQRLMLLRLLVQRPAWAILDEATSALDEATERDILALLHRELPETTFVMISHHMPRGMGELRQIDLDPFRAEPQAQAA
jgi:putative ATP-binding cassette transporter